MFNLISKDKGYLFCTYELEPNLREARQKMSQEVEGWDENRVLNTPPEDLKRYLINKYGVEPLRLRKDEWHADHQDIQVDVRYDQRRLIRDASRPVLVPGERFEVRMPFDGDENLFYFRSNTVTTTLPRGIISNGELLLRYDSPADSPSDVRSAVDRAVSEIEQHISWQKPLLDSHNQGLPQAASEVIEQRRHRLLARSNRAANLGIPIRRREDAPKTYTIPTARKKAMPSLPPVSKTPFTPEPTWAMEQYEQALKIMQDMALVMERSPNAFKSMDEEALRQHFLVQLNGQFEGQATGETFNMSGKTDILLREGDRNVFIAECKFWKGPKAFSDAVDQLLGYSTWRDSKSAILVFNRGTNPSTVLEGVDAAVKAHPNFKRREAWVHESGLRYVLKSREDVTREQMVTVLVFHVPT